MPDSKGGGEARGDLYVRLRIVLPRSLNDDQRALFEKLREQSDFDPRA
jgi:DnaJ-class molecular chaperone